MVHTWPTMVLWEVALLVRTRKLDLGMPVISKDRRVRSPRFVGTIW